MSYCLASDTLWIRISFHLLIFLIEIYLSQPKFVSFKIDSQVQLKCGSRGAAHAVISPRQSKSEKDTSDHQEFQKPKFKILPTIKDTSDRLRQILPTVDDTSDRVRKKNSHRRDGALTN